MLFERVQNGLRVAVLIAAVKGEVDDLLPGVPQIPGVVLCQFLPGGVAHRGLALDGEGQSPVPGGGGDGGVPGDGQRGGLFPAQQQQGGQSAQGETDGEGGGTVMAAHRGSLLVHG